MDPHKHADGLDFDLDRALKSIVTIQSSIPEDAFTASILGERRGGSGVVIRESGLVLTIGYLITEAENVWIARADRRVTPGHAVAVDAETGFGLVQALDRLDCPALELGRSSDAKLGDPVVVAAGGDTKAVHATIVGKQEFAGYWEYLLEEAIFTAPAHPFWGGAGLFAEDGSLIGIGSLVLQQGGEGAKRQDMNMVVTSELLLPILEDLLKFGRANRPPRPWLGLYAMEDDEALVVGGLAHNGPADKAGLRTGDRILAVNGAEVPDLAGLWRAVWATGPAGCPVQVSLGRGNRNTSVTIPSADRSTILKSPRLH